MRMRCRTCSLLLSALLLSLTACQKEADASTAYADLELGKSFTDLKAKISVVTYRTDLIDDDPNVRDLHDYTSEFNAMYPGIEVMYEGITDYDVDMSTRLNSGDWDVCSIPGSTPRAEFSNYFDPLFELEEYQDKYEFVDAQVYEGTVYGIPVAGNAQGIVYNKKVFADAGITDVPKTPDDFLAALEKIRANTDAIPLYTNYAARWTMGAWDYYCFGAATGDPDYHKDVIPFEKDPFSQREDHTGPYEVYSVLYQAVSRGLIEDDPYNTNWEMCKARLNNGEIGCMVLGSWAVPQMQQAGDHAEDIGYMPFPLTVNGVQYACAGGDYAYAINTRSADEEKLAARLYIKFMIEQSNFAYDQGGIPIVKGQGYPNVFADFQDTVLIKDTTISEGETDWYDLVNKASGINLETDPDHVMRIVDAAYTGSESFEDIINDWNAAWTKGQQDVSAPVK